METSDFFEQFHPAVSALFEKFTNRLQILTRHAFDQRGAWVVLNKLV